MSDLQIESILKGIASGNYVRKIGSQFGSLWGFDGLVTAEATPEEYAGFGRSSDIRLGYSGEVDWLERKWASILTYRRQQLAQVSIYVTVDEKLKASVLTKLSSMLGDLGGSEADRSWIGRDGVVTLTFYDRRLQIDARRLRLSERLIRVLLFR